MGLVHIARACASFSMATSRVSIVTCPRMYTVNGRIYDDIRFPHIFPGSSSACARNVYQAFSHLKGPGYEANTLLTNFHIIVNLASSMTYAIHWAREGLVLCTRIQGNTEILYIHTTLM